MECRGCGAVWPEDRKTCDDCGASLVAGISESGLATIAGHDQETERKKFQVKYGVDIGDSTVEEYLQYLERQDYSVTIPFWSIVVGEIVTVGLSAYALFGPGGRGLLPVFLGVSVLLSLSIYADTAHVKLFDRWAVIRWLYIGVALTPLAGQIGAFFYLVLRRLKRERTQRVRRHLLESGLDVDGYPG